MKTKSFDAVKFMRERRDELSKKYNKSPNAQNDELSDIKRKYRKLRGIISDERTKNLHSFAK